MNTPEAAAVGSRPLLDVGIEKKKKYNPVVFFFCVLSLTVGLLLLEQNPSRLLRSISNRIRKVFFSVFLSRFALSSVYHIPSSWTTDEHFSKSRSVFLNVFRFQFLFLLWRHWRIGMGSADPISDFHLFICLSLTRTRKKIYIL